MTPPTGTVFSAEERSRVAREVLAIAAALVAELGGAAVTPSLAHSIERDLGIGSLERVELLLRLERAFGVRLTDAVMAEAVTLDDLVEAVMLSQPRVVEAMSSPAAPPGAGVSAPASAATLVDVLEWHAEHAPDRVHLHLREDDAETPLAYGELLATARGVASGLRALGVRRGDTVALMLRTEPAFFPTFFGTLIAGAVPVPVYPPFRPDQIEEYAQRQRAILRNAGVRVLVTFADALRVAKLSPVRGGTAARDAVRARRARPIRFAARSGTAGCHPA